MALEPQVLDLERVCDANSTCII